MPTYAYHCDSCSHEFQKVLKISDRDVPTQEPCPSCAEVSVRKLLGASATVYTLSPTTVSKTGRVDEGFKERLQQIHNSAGEGSTMKNYCPWIK